MVQVVRTLYKIFSTALFVSGLYTFFKPTEAMGYIFRTSPVVHVLPIFLAKIFGTALVILSACICTATTSASSSKSTGAGLAIGGLLLLLLTQTQDLPAIMDIKPIFALSLSMSILGLLGFYAGPPSEPVATARVAQEQGGKKSRAWQSYQSRAAAKEE